MTIQEARTFAQADPITALSKRWGELAHETRKAVANLEDKLRELDQVTQDLAGHNLHVTTDLGPVGNAARNARTAQLADQDADRFTLPQVA